MDETNGRLFVSTPNHPPCCGTFFVRPFEFLSFLHSLYSNAVSADLRNLLAARLNVSRGGVHPSAVGPRSGLKEFEQLWSHSWAILWGPPGCGKTTNVGRQVAACLDGDERILVVSTTNKATDAAALAIGKAAYAVYPRAVEDGRILRIGKGANYQDYEVAALKGLLRGTETELLRKVGALKQELARAQTHDQRAVLRRQIQELQRYMKDSAFNIFGSPAVRVVIATAFKAVTLLRDPAIRSMAVAGKAPFTTVVIDEAGLMSRPLVAALSILASRRVVVVGDAKQLAPISKVSRILPTQQATWLASSSLSHLQQVHQLGQGVHLLREQHRMHPHVSRVVSHYQYDGALKDAASVENRKATTPFLLEGQPRAIWYVLDEDCQDISKIRAERGPGNRSWLRPWTREILGKLFSHTEAYRANGLFITPFRAQAKDIAQFFAAEHLENWSAGTVHSRQGTEADVVIFDTVNAGSCGWDYNEWKRLVNVGLSRARECVLLLASRAEMSEPYLRPLLDNLAPRILKRCGKKLTWTEVSAEPAVKGDSHEAANPNLVGCQLARRKSLRPVMSKEQQQLCGHKMDGKPRLVRGVAGSGKTLVLAHWLQKTVQILADRPDARVCVVYANQSLKRLIADTIEEAWQTDGGKGQSPLNRVVLHHIKDLLQTMFVKAGLRWSGDRWDYNAQAAEYLKQKPFEQVEPCCQAMFIDEAQDMGSDALRLLTALVEQTDPANPKSRAVHIFYDNAQNIYRRPMPKWSEIGLDIVGRRSTIMKESFRSTRPITEFALNVLYRLQPPEADPDHKELVKQGLIELTTRNGLPWWNVRFNQVDGPRPIFRKFSSLAYQVTALTEQVMHWILVEHVRPCDISIVCNDHAFKGHVMEELGPRLKAIKARVIDDPGVGEARDVNTVVVSPTPSFKGYEAEIVVVGGLERFIGKGEVLPNNLYVAMTRARSILAVYAYQQAKPKPEAAKLLTTVEECLNSLSHHQDVEHEISNLDDFEDVVSVLDEGNKAWLERLWKRFLIHQEPIIAKEHEILAEPLFWFQVDDRVVACFGNEKPGAHTMHKLEDHGIEVIQPGQEVGSLAGQNQSNETESAPRNQDAHSLRAYASPLLQDTVAAEDFFEKFRVQCRRETLLGNA